MKSRLKKITIFSLVFLFIFGTAITTTPKQQVKADDGYNGKIFRHWCKLRASKSKRSKVLKRLEIGTPVTVYSPLSTCRIDCIRQVESGERCSNL